MVKIKPKTEPISPPTPQVNEQAKSQPTQLVIVGDEDLLFELLGL